MIINAETKTGYLTIKLDSSIRIEATAINEKLICYMDKDIISGNYTLHKGDYEFDKSIGRFGGYKLNITEK